jgi:hypothetical protein
LADSSPAAGITDQGRGTVRTWLVPRFEDFPDSVATEVEVVLEVKAGAVENIDKAVAAGTHFADLRSFWGHRRALSDIERARAYAAAYARQPRLQDLRV